MISRTQPKKIIEELLKEVNFGCPFPECGSPFLTIHHFDPKWSEKQHHDPDGMIALCPEHHNMADIGIYTKEQLRYFKKNSYIQDKIKVKWPWDPEKIVFRMGGSILFGTRPALTLESNKILEVKKKFIPSLNRAIFSFDMNILDKKGKFMAKMVDNYLSVPIHNLKLLRFSTKGHAFKVEHEDGSYLNLKFKRNSLEEFRKLLKCNFEDNLVFGIIEIAKKISMDSDNKIPIVTILGHFSNPNIDIHILENKINFICYFYNNEEVNLPPKVFLPSGSLRITLGKKDILKFG